MVICNVCIGWMHTSARIQRGNTEAPYWRPRFQNLAGNEHCGALRQDAEVTFLARWSFKGETSLRKLSFSCQTLLSFSHVSSPGNNSSILLKYLHRCHQNSEWPPQIKATQSPHLQGLKPSLNSLHKHAKPVTELLTALKARPRVRTEERSAFTFPFPPHLTFS